MNTDSLAEDTQHPENLQADFLGKALELRARANRAYINATIAALAVLPGGAYMAVKASAYAREIMESLASMGPRATTGDQIVGVFLSTTYEWAAWRISQWAIPVPGAILVTYLEGKELAGQAREVREQADVTSLQEAAMPPLLPAASSSIISQE